MKNLADLSVRQSIVARIDRVRPESIALWGRMSAHQMVCHLSDSFLVVTGQKPVSHSTSLLQRTIVKWMALYLPLPWPAAIPTRPEIDQELGGTRPVDFAQDVALGKDAGYTALAIDDCDGANMPVEHEAHSIRYAGLNRNRRGFRITHLQHTHGRLRVLHSIERVIVVINEIGAL